MRVYCICAIQYLVSFLNRFKRNKEQKPERSAIEARAKLYNNAAKFQAERQKITKLRRDTARSMWWSENKSAVLIGFGVFSILAVIITALLLLRNANQFDVTKIVVRGNQVARNEQVLESISWVKDQNLYELSVASVEKDLLEKFPYFRQVQVRKVLPDSLLVEITERAAVMTYINISTAVTVDSEGQVIAIFDEANLIPLSAETMQVIQGFGNIDSGAVQSKYYTKYQDDLSKFRLTWDEVKPEDKQTALAELAAEYQAQIAESLQARLDKVDPSIRESLPIMQDLSAQQFDQAEQMPINKFNYGFAILQFFAEQDIEVRQLLWVTDFNIVATLSTNTRVIFTATRDLNEQLNAFDTIRRVEDISRAQQVDVRANVVSVR